MGLLHYILRSIRYYRRQHWALFLGMVISTAVLTGALIIGDSVRMSLHRIVDNRLGKTQYALFGGSRFFDVQLAEKLSKHLGNPAAPLLMLQGIAIHPEKNIQINKVSVIGMTSSFASFGKQAIPTPGKDEVVIGQELASRLNIMVGEELILKVENKGTIPVNAPFAKESSPSKPMRLRVIAIANAEQLGRFNLSNNQGNMNNAFVSLEILNKELGLKEAANCLLLGEGPRELNPALLEDTMQKLWSLKDLGLSIQNRPEMGKYDLLSDRIFIDPVVVQSINQQKLLHQEIITYLINDLTFNGRSTPYSFASAISGIENKVPVVNGDVWINSWTADDLNAGTGDSVDMTFYQIGQLRELKEVTKKFRIGGIIKNQSEAADSTLMPRFPGMSEAGNCRDWDAGVPVDFKRIRDKDEKYWDDFRGTPKMIISIETARKLWQNPFGSFTALRFQDSVTSRHVLTSTLLSAIKPSDIGWRWVSVRKDGDQAAQNAVDFTGLFLGMSFFTIFSGMMLTMLIYALNFYNRSWENGILSAIGINAEKIIRLRFTETVIVLTLGSIIGSLAGIGYNYLLVANINTLWNDIVRTDYLQVNINFPSLLAGILGSIILIIIPVYLITRRKLKKPVVQQVKSPVDRKNWRRTTAWGWFIVAGALVISIGLLGTKYKDNSVLYLLLSVMFLAGGLLIMGDKFKKGDPSNKEQVFSIRLLALKNLQRNFSRSLTVIILLALGTFTIILTGAYRKTYFGTERERSSGTGGFLLWGETTTPVQVNFNGREGRNRLNLEQIHETDSLRFFQFRELEGDDASCLNLNQAQHPKILAVYPEIFDSLKAFSYSRLLPGIDKEHFWKGLEITVNDSTFYAFADQNVIQYSLKKNLGDTLFYRNESGKLLSLILAGALNSSVFQGNILISDRIFQTQFPSMGGTRTFLVDAPLSKQVMLTRILSESLSDYGIEITSTSERLAAFNSVENTYLTVFMALSGLGFIIGTIGLGIVLIRNMNERKQELALLLALGYSQKLVFKAVLFENLILLIAGLGLGMISAFIGIIPSIISPGYANQTPYMLVLMGSTFISGFLWIYFPLKTVFRKSLLQSLLNE